MIIICCGKKFKVGKQTYTCDNYKGHEELKKSRCSMKIMEVYIDSDGKIFIIKDD